MILLDAVKDFCAELGWDKTYWIAYSGGLDSSVLLALCQTLRQRVPIKLRAIHINHGLHPQALDWAQHCEQVCHAYDIDCVVSRIHLNVQSGQSLEEVAREQRYARFADKLQANDVLLTAHQEDDQAETVLLQLLRGAGLKGLAAMPRVKPFAQGLHGRPLLPFSRELLHQYAIQAQLKWIDDTSNDQLHFTRNFIRHQVLSVLKSRWPTVTATISRSAQYCAESQTLLEEYALGLLKEVKGSFDHTLSVTKLVALDVARQRLLLRTWIQQQGYSLPDAKKLQTMLQTVLLAAPDRMPCVEWATVALRRYRDDLYLTGKLFFPDSNRVINWDLNEPLRLLGMGTLRAAMMQGQGIRADIQQVTVKFREGGELAQLPGRGKRALKYLFQEWGVPTWERSRVPLIFRGDQLIGVVGWFLDSNYTAKPHEMGYVLTLES